VTFNKALTACQVRRDCRRVGTLQFRVHNARLLWLNFPSVVPLGREVSNFPESRLQDIKQTRGMLLLRTHLWPTDHSHQASYQDRYYLSSSWMRCISLLGSAARRCFNLLSRRLLVIWLTAVVNTRTWAGCWSIYIWRHIAPRSSDLASRIPEDSASCYWLADKHGPNAQVKSRSSWLFPRPTSWGTQMPLACNLYFQWNVEHATSCLLRYIQCHGIDMLSVLS
jgi:hypothetical protein